MKKSLSLIALIVIAVISLSSQSPINPSGQWKIAAATTYDGKAYTGEVNIIQKGSVYTLDWRTSAGNYPGVGILDGNNLMVGWGINIAHGVVVYNIETGMLRGRWSSAGETAVGTENVTLTNGQLEGTHVVAGSNPGGGDYNGKVIFKKSGDLYNVSWMVGQTQFNGIGIKVGEKIVVGWGFGTNFGVIHYTLSEKEAKGEWAIPGATKVATENLIR